jgi:hypothetical protein
VKSVLINDLMPLAALWTVEGGTQPYNPALFLEPLIWDRSAVSTREKRRPPVRTPTVAVGHYAAASAQNAALASQRRLAAAGSRESGEDLVGLQRVK